ncbi:hypothetical protein FYK55_21070 [Roseiconus nitratireducens]|uniref:SGNH hydrolase-type esterase domain-containing protein n=1 Tax=Roseiconus nitratireducens TaxID=2605748 RepID=A0A5M6D1J2_9BACT|nr:hypothetical protein FYK55_21070 [Roseiconus nitratireducens]
MQTADLDHHYEVVNCGGVSYASYRVARILGEVLQHAPDAIVIYTGHNEFLEERSYATLSKPPSWFSRMGNQLRLVAAIRQTLRGRPDTEDLPQEVSTRLDQPGGLELYVRDEAWRRAVVEHFAINLRRMVQACQAAGVPLYLCVPTSDCVNTPPIKIQSLPPGEIDRQRFDQAWSRACDGESTDAARLAACKECLAIDPHHAGAHYIAGKLHWDRGNSSLAAEHLIAARDDDVCPLRATTPILQQVEQLGDQPGLTLIRCDHLFDRSDAAGRPLPDGLADPSQFVDHVHPTVNGHQEIGEQLATAFARDFGIAMTEKAMARYREQAERHLATLDETYYARGKQRLEGLRQWASGRAGELSLD